MVGIYKILCKINNKVYIGSSNNIERRFKRHKTELHCNIHCNEYLQRAYNKYGLENFEFIVIEECNTEDIITKELYYINLYNSLNYLKGYNQTLPRANINMLANKKYLQKLSNSKKGKKPLNWEDMIKVRWKRVKVYKNGEFLGIFSSYTETERTLGINKGYLYSYFKNPNHKRQKYKQYKFEKI